MLRKLSLLGLALCVSCGDETPDYPDASVGDAGGRSDACREEAPCALSEGMVASEFIGEVGDEDPFVFEVGSPGRIIDIAVYNDATFSPVQLELALFGPGDVALVNRRSQGTGRQRVQIQLSAEAAGSHRLVVRDVGGDDRDVNNPFYVELRLLDDSDGNEPNDSSAEATALTLGTPVSGAIETQGDSDWFKVDLMEGRRVGIEVSAPETGAVTHRWTLFGPDGTTAIAQGLEGQPGWGQDVRPVRASGTHFLRVEDDDAQQGESGRLYTVRLVDLEEPDANEAGGRNDTMATASVVSPGSVVEGYLASSGDIDWFAIDVPAASEASPALLEARVAYASGSPVELRMVVFEPDGQTLVCERRDGDLCRAVRLIRDGQGEDGPTALATAHPVTAPGRYLVTIQDLQNDEVEDGVPYQLTVSLPTEPDAFEGYQGDGRGAARLVPAQSSTTGAVIEFPWVEGYISYAGDTDWYAFDLPSRAAAIEGENQEVQNGDWRIRLELQMVDPTPVELNAFFYGEDGSDRERYRGVGKQCRNPDGPDDFDYCQWPEAQNVISEIYETSTPESGGDECFVVFREVTADGLHYWRVSDLDRDDFDLAASGRYRFRMTVTAGCPSDSVCMGRFLRNGNDLCGRD